jgi:hypothetical protein
VTTPDPLAALRSRGFEVYVDDGELPVCVTVQMPHGLRHYYGGSTESALCRALEATTPRAPKDEEP